MEESILMTLHYGQVDQNPQNLIRETEAEDIRITEQGDTRITNELILNQVTSTLSATASLIGFNSQAYVKDGGAWEDLLNVYVKRNGSWVIPDKIYVNENGNWKRVL